MSCRHLFVVNGVCSDCSAQGSALNIAVAPSYTDDVVAVMRDTITAQRETIDAQRRTIEALSSDRFTRAECEVLDALAKATITTSDDGKPMMGIEDEWRVCRKELSRRGISR